MTSKRLPMISIKKVLIAILLLLVVVAGIAIGCWFYFERWLHAPLNLPANGYTYELKPGRSLGHMTLDLERQGILSQARWLTFYARATHATHVQAGEYLLTPELTPFGLLQKLKRGNVVVYHVTLLEGWTYQQALGELHAKDTLTAKLRDQSLTQQLELLALPIDHPEGWFFPDTYTYTRGTSDIELLRRAYARMEQILQNAWQERADNLPYRTPYDALIMASIVERETGAPWERDQVAGVFVRRLQMGMRLQTDPTVIYGMGANYRGKITRKDLQESTAYNTYVITGLPPTPIALPGRASLHAALNPAQGTAIYFVAKGDGTTQFSDTLAEHNRAVRRYQLQRRADYRSTIAPTVAPEEK
jgi:UPF0755 protein